MNFADFLVMFPARASRVYREKPWEVRFSNRVFASPLEEKTPLLTELETASWKFLLLGELYQYRHQSLRNENAKILLGHIAEDIQKTGEINPTYNGHCLLLAQHKISEEWHLWTNRFGTYHGYYASDGKRAAIGTYFLSVADAASQKQLDWEGMSGFFKFGFFPQDRTYFQDVKILRPATHYIFDENGKKLSESRYWNWHHEPNPKRSYEDSVVQFGETLEQILSDQTASGRLALPISSGLDSRTVAAVMTKRTEKRDNRLWTYSYGYTEDSVETKIAERIAKARGLSFNRFTIPVYLWDRMDLILKSVEGFQGIVSTRQAAISEEVASKADYLMAAHWGDVWMDDMGWKHRAKGGGQGEDEEILNHAIHRIQKPGGEWLIENICKPQLGGIDPNEMLREMVKEELDKLKYIEDPDFRIKAFKTDQWSFRWTCASLRMFQPGAFPRLPFYDNRMADFCSTLPTDYVRGRRLQIDYLKKYHSDLAKITWDVTDSNLYHYQYYNSWLLPKRILKKIGRMATGYKHLGRNWEIQFLNEKGKQGLHHWLLKENLKIHSFISPYKIQNLVDEVTNQPNAANGYALSQLLTTSAWMENFA